MNTQELIDELRTIHNGHADEGPSTFSEAADTIQALQAEVDALRPDAERYRFLKGNPYFQIEYTGALTLDEHIDAAKGNV